MSGQKYITLAQAICCLQTSIDTITNHTSNCLKYNKFLTTISGPQSYQIPQPVCQRDKPMISPYLAFRSPGSILTWLLRRCILRLSRCLRIHLWWLQCANGHISLGKLVLRHGYLLLRWRCWLRLASRGLGRLGSKLGALQGVYLLICWSLTSSTIGWQRLQELLELLRKGILVIRIGRLMGRNCGVSCNKIATLRGLEKIYLLSFLYAKATYITQIKK